MAKTKSLPETVTELLQGQAITPADLDAAVDAFLIDPKIGLFEVAPGRQVDLTAAVRADRHATAILTEPTARAGSRRAAVRSAILLARSVKN
ncbi:hypothetical protein ACRBEV_32865 (plasmid) [Methylobacterium phyllosphaerae]